jgi:hypothetical protein
MSYHISPLIIYSFISMTHYKSLISIISTYKYATLSHTMSSFSIKKYFWRFKEYATSPYISMTHYKSLISILSTCKYVTSSHIMSSFYIENIFENSRRTLQETSVGSVIFIGINKYNSNYIHRSQEPTNIVWIIFVRWGHITNEYNQHRGPMNIVWIIFIGEVISPTNIINIDVASLMNIWWQG